MSLVVNEETKAQVAKCKTKVSEYSRDESCYDFTMITMTYLTLLTSIPSSVKVGTFYEAVTIKLLNICKILSTFLGTY